MPMYRGHQSCLESEKAIQSSYAGAKLASTCEWFLDHKAYRAWFAAAGPPLLELHGGTGRGKSTICSAIVDDLLRRQQHSDVIVYCFFEEGRGMNDCAKHILEVLFRQMQERNAIPGYLFYTLLPEIEKTGSPMSRKAFKRFLKTLIGYIGCENRIVLVLDGLDEYEWIECLIIDEVIHVNNLRHRSGLMRCLRSSRKSCDDKTYRSQSRRISLDSELGAQRDILQFAESRLVSIYPSLGKAKGYLTSFAKRICRQGQGIFLWVDLVTENLQCVKSIPEAERQVQSLPPTVDGLYQRALQNIPPEETAILQKAFACLIAANRPLELPELMEALAIGTNPHRLPGSGTLANWICSPLFITTKDNTIRLRHPSLRRYLLSADGTGIWGTSIFEAHKILADVCLTLMTPEGDNDSPFPLEPQAVGRISSLNQYALTHWSCHYRWAEPHCKRLVGTLRWYLNITLNRACGELSLPETVRLDHIEVTVLRIAAHHGFTSLARMSLEMGGNKKGVCSSCESPLALAAAGGHSDVVALLIQQGASTQQDLGETALHLAAASGVQESADLLLEYGAEADSNTDYLGRTHCISQLLPGA